jgi:hypothetical protein
MVPVDTDEDLRGLTCDIIGVISSGLTLFDDTSKIRHSSNLLSSRVL